MTNTHLFARTRTHSCQELDCLAPYTMSTASFSPSAIKRGRSRNNKSLLVASMVAPVVHDPVETTDSLSTKGYNVLFVHVK